ncbi:hypothetical protein ACFLW3_01330 [Chloroflexota bacterium]
MAKANKTNVATQELTQDLDHLQQRLEILDQRLDNIDSVVTALVERVMNQPIALNLTCPSCGKDIEIAILGTQKPKR